MRARPAVTGWCPSVPGVEGQDWWPARFIYKGGHYMEDGEEIVRLLVLCPSCGKWVPSIDRSLPDHELPKGSDLDRIRKVEKARKAYTLLRMRQPATVASAA